MAAKWWTDMSPKQRQKYIREHPNSIYAKGGVSGSVSTRGRGRAGSAARAGTDLLNNRFAKGAANFGIGLGMTSLGLTSLDAMREGALPKVVVGKKAAKEAVPQDRRVTAPDPVGPTPTGQTALISASKKRAARRKT